MRSFARILTLMLIVLAASSPTARAQEWSLEIEGDYVRLNVPPGAEPPSVDELASRLAEYLGLPSVAAGVVRAGDVMFTAPVQYGRTWRLQNDVFRRGSQEVFLPRGTPLHETEYQYEVTASGRTEDTTVYDLRWRIWCAPPPPGDSRGAVEICIRTRRGVAEAARLREYRSSSGGADYFPVTWPELVEDAGAADELPRHEWVYVLQHVSRRQIVVRQSVRYSGRTEDYETLRIGSDANGAFVVPYGAASVILTPEGDGFRTGLRTEPDIREFAASLLQSGQQDSVAPSN